jgi:hypothetical protein
MKYLKPQHMVCLNDRDVSLSVLADLATQAQGDEAIRQSILDKIERHRAADLAQYTETKLPDGTVRVRHPSVAVIELDHYILPKPVQMFGNHSKSLVGYTFTISRADIVVHSDGLVAYEPHEVVGVFKLSETSFNRLISNPDRMGYATTIEMVKGYHIEPTIDSAFTSLGRKIAAMIPAEVQKMTDNLAQVTQTLEGLAAKGGKLSKTSIDDLSRNLPSTDGMARNASYNISRVSEFAQETTTTQRLEIEALISLRQRQGDK